MTNERIREWHLSPLSDNEIIDLAARYPRGLYEEGIDEGVRRCKDTIEEQRHFIESLHSAIRELGFRPLGLSREQEILLAVQALADQRTREDTRLYGGSAPHE